LIFRPVSLKKTGPWRDRPPATTGATTGVGHLYQGRFKAFYVLDLLKERISLSGSSGE